MSADDTRKKAIATELYKKGSEAMSKQNWDYAVDMLGKASLLVPDNLVYRQTLRGAERNKYKDNGKGASMSGMRLMKIKGRIRKAKSAKDWEAMEAAAEEGLAVNPWDPVLNAELALAAANRGNELIGIFALQTALKKDPDNKTYLKDLAELLKERGEYQEAIKCWTKIQQLDPLDSEARSRIASLHADSTIDRGGYEKADDTQTVKKGYEERIGGPTGSAPIDGPGMSAEADLQRAIRKEPDAVENYLKLADLYRRENRLREAMEHLGTALEKSNDNPNVREEMEDVELDMLRREMAQAKDLSKSAPDDEDLKKDVKTRAVELIKREVEVLTRRVERYPANMQVKFQLAHRHMTLKNWKGAIPLLQQARNDPRLESDALFALGKCFINDGQPQLAKRAFERAVPKLDHSDKPSVFKECHYMLGRLLEEDGNLEEAENHYSEVLGVDYEYKDIQVRIQEIQKKGA